MAYLYFIKFSKMSGCVVQARMPRWCSHLRREASEAGASKEVAEESSSPSAEVPPPAKRRRENSPPTAAEVSKVGAVFMGPLGKG